MDTFKKVYAKRHSTRTFDSLKPISQQTLEALKIAAHMAPSCYNDQPWYFLICEKATDPKAYELLLSTLVEFNQNWAKQAPILIAIIADTQFSKNAKPNRWGPFDTGASAVSLAYEAASLGLMAHQMGGFDEKKLSALFQIPERYIPMSVMALGYEGVPEKPPIKEREKLENHFFHGQWNLNPQKDA